MHSGLREGVRLPYECATGTCGTCRARIVSGTVDVHWSGAPGAKRLKPEKGDILMCQANATSDVVLRVPFDITVSDMPRPRTLTGTMRAVRRLTHDVIELRLDLSESIEFEAGQFVVLKVGDVVGGRAYSMVNFGQALKTLSFVIKRRPAGGLTSWLFDREHDQNHEVEVFGPLGKAVFYPDQNMDIICIAGGSGIAGMMSILQHAQEIDYFESHRGQVFFGVRTLADGFYLDVLSRYVEASHGNLAVTIAYSDDADPSRHDTHPGLSIASGFVHLAAANVSRDDYQKSTTFIAGPPEMVDLAIRNAIIGGAARKNIRYDKFG